MRIFNIVTLTAAHTAAMASIVAAKFPTDHYQVTSNVWLVAGNGTAKEISDRLGIGDEPPKVEAVVTSIDGYFGRAPVTVWDWLKVKMEQAPIAG